jgi:DNA-binding NarL/FixJ family response regulator
MIRVLVVDDQALVRSGFRAILETQPDIEVVGEASNGQQALAQARDRPVDVVLMDVRMPELDGIEATRQLMNTADPPRVLMLTTFDLDEHLYDAMKAGASGFLLKDVPREQLIDAVRVVSRGDTLLAPSITRRLIERFLRRPPPGAVAAPGLDALSDRELQVLRVLARGYSNDEIATELFLSPATVKTHVGHILDKLGLRDRVQAVVLAYESGFVELGSDQSPNREQPTRRP